MRDGVIGVDEAGKGPVLGSMFAAAVWVPTVEALPEGVDDSKRLTPARREELAGRLREHSRVTVGVREVPVERIDDPETDMNSLTVEAHAAAVDQLADGGERVLADACDTSEARFARRLTDGVAADVDVHAEHGADERRAVVAAASVLAKVRRDDHVAALADEHGAVGSGYPGDATTRAFLEDYVDEHGEVPPCARSSWRTCEELLADREQAGLGEF